MYYYFRSYSFYFLLPSSEVIIFANTVKHFSIYHQPTLAISFWFWTLYFLPSYGILLLSLGFILNDFCWTDLVILLFVSLVLQLTLTTNMTTFPQFGYPYPASSQVRFFSIFVYLFYFIFVFKILTVSRFVYIWWSLMIVCLLKVVSDCALSIACKIQSLTQNLLQLFNFDLSSWTCFEPL